MSILAPIVGIIVGWLMSKWLKRIHNNPILEGNLTICVPYILFYVCEHFKMSGILGLVACGLYMTKTGKTKISVESEHSVHAIWSYIGFVAETVIFGITGLILGDIVYDYFDAIWLAQLFGLYVLLHIVRFTFVLIAWPAMSCTGYKFTFKHCVLVSYGGLRGAVGLALAIMVQHSEEVPEDVRRVTLFHIAGIVLLTLVINGTTTGFVIDCLGLKKES